MRYGDILPADFNVPSSAFWLITDLTADRNPFKLVEIRPGDRVMDCGLFIGTFTSACMEQGAAIARCYEAAPKNALIAKENLARYGDAVTIVEAALTATEKDSVMLTMANFSGANSILPGAIGKKSIAVPAVNFRRELMAFHPTVVKIDVEGAEYDLLDSLQPGDLVGVRCLFIEFHPVGDRDIRVDAIKDRLLADGFTFESQKLRVFVASRNKQAMPADLFSFPEEQ